MNNIKYYFFSYISVLAFPVALGLKDSSINFSNSVLDILLFISFYKLIKYAFNKCNKRQVIFSVSAGLILSTTLILGANIKNTNSALLWDISTYLYIITLSPLLSAIVCGTYRGIDKLRDLTDDEIEKKYGLFLQKKKIFFWWIILILGWLPALLATFPGIYSYDAIFQVKSFFDHAMSNHHPILHTMWLGISMKIGIDVFHSSQVGLFLYTITQMFAFSGMLAYMMYWLQFKIPSVGVWFVLVCLIVLPYNSLLTISATKDTIFAGIFVMVVLRAYDLVRDPRAFLSSFNKTASLVFFLILLCLFRNNGIYVVCFMMLFALFILRRYWKRVSLVGLLCISFWLFYTNIGYGALNITKNDMREMLSVPFQQMVRSLQLNEEELTLDEKEYIQACFPDYKNYSPTISDNIKSTARMDIIQGDFGEFIKKWVDIGYKCPYTYLDAWLVLSCGNWYPDTLYPIPGAWHPYLMYDNCTADDGHGHGGDYIWVNRISLLPSLSKFYSQICYDTIYQKAPLIANFMNPGSFFWVLIIMGSYCIYRRNYICIVPFSLLIGLWGTIMLGPVALLRYSYPLMLSTPIIFAIAIEKNYMTEKI